MAAIEPVGGTVGGPSAQGEVAPRPRVLVFTTLFPNPAQPRLGVFIRDRVVAVAAHCPTRVVAPVLTRLGFRRLEHGSAGTVPLAERQGPLLVDHPRFNTVPKVGRFADGMVLFLQTVAHMRRLRVDFPFDVIDAHYAFPDGAAAVLLGRRFAVPVCVTLRGGDIDLLPRFRLRRQVIRWTLKHADRVFAVSQHLARGAARLGLAAGEVQVVPNGIDPGTFAPIDRGVARQRLGIADEAAALDVRNLLHLSQVPSEAARSDPTRPPEASGVRAGSGPAEPVVRGPASLVLCVGNLLAEKGQHVLIEALEWLRRNGEHIPQLVIIGSDQQGNERYKQRLTQRVKELGLSDRVSLLGSKPQAELAVWYSAADVVVLPTFREGCPNVVREALACGAPVVASRVGGVPELVTSGALGLLVEPGDVDGLAAAISTALRHRWDRAAIAAAGSQRTWQSVAEAMVSQFSSVVRETA